MVELADTQDLGSCIVRCAGSSPVIRTNRTATQRLQFCYFYDIISSIQQTGDKMICLTTKEAKFTLWEH